MTDTDEVEALCKRLDARKTFFSNGANWMMATSQDEDCKDAAALLRRLKGDLNVAHIAYIAKAEETDAARAEIERLRASPQGNTKKAEPR